MYARDMTNDIVEGFINLLFGQVCTLSSIFREIHVSGSVGPISLFVDLFKMPLVVLNLLTANYMLKLIFLFFCFFHVLWIVMLRYSA